MNLLAIPAMASAGYHVFALIAGLRKLTEPVFQGTFAPPVSILKPVRGCDERFHEAIKSHACQDYPEYEILFGISDSDDPARAVIEKLIASYPRIPIRLLEAPNDAPNGKVGVLETLAREARHAFLVVNDSDILVGRDYLREVIAPLDDERAGLVTCLYRGAAGSFAARSEALGVATEFAPSVLVARQVGVREFAMGSTLALRAADLAAIGGFAAIRDYLADDYQLGKRLTGLGLDVTLARPVVDTWLGAGNWREIWAHQRRWSRTIRVSRPSGYAGYAITHTAFWCLLAALAGDWRTALVCYAARFFAGAAIAGFVLRDWASLRMCWWMPFRDLFGCAVWVAGLAGTEVKWRGKRLRIDREGKIF